MTTMRNSVEISAPSVAEAVERGLSQLGMKREEVEIVVLEEGRPADSPGGGIPARVRLTAPEGAAEPDPELDTAREVVEELLQRMRMRASVSAKWTEPEGAGEAPHALVDIHGPDLGIMVSRRGEALTALQYLARMIASHKLGRPLPVIVDVEGYRKRREEQLRRMARRAAEQAVERARTVELEPMPANERRIIHLELRDHPGVTTESVGLGRSRKVTILPKVAGESETPESS
jgi:spoIIIJ-associated protein